MFIELPVYGVSSRATTNHETHSIWVPVESITMIEEDEWKDNPGNWGAYKVNPEDRPNLCTVKAAGEVFSIAMNHKEAVKFIEKKLAEKKLAENKDNGDKKENKSSE